MSHSNPIPLEALRRGALEPPTTLQRLQAGPLSILLEPGGLRYVKLGETEIIRRIYAAVRDRNWGTVPAEISEWQLDASPESFRVNFVSTHRGRGTTNADGSPEEIHFVWRGEIRGEPDGSLAFDFDGEALTSFLKNRIGFCILHPIRECAGAPCRALHANGSSQALHFPVNVAPEQPVRGLHDLVGLSHEVTRGVWAELRFSGDLFEVEDQRNWIDASFKTFCTPLRIPFPLEVNAGTRVRQSVSLKLLGEPAAIAGAAGARQTEDSAVVVEREASPRQESPLPGPGPGLGLGAPSHGQRHSTREIERLRAMQLAHLRVDVHAARPDAPDLLERSAHEARKLAIPVEVALHVDEAVMACPALLDTIAARLRSVACTLARVLVLGHRGPSTTGEALQLVRDRWGFLGAPIGAGTDAYFDQLNRIRPAAGGDFIAWSMNPQIHSTDELSIAETPVAAAHQVDSARLYFPGIPLVVSPLTLKPRFNAVATGPELPPPPDELPPQVDARQASLFAAAWTLAVLKHLSESGASSVTCFETTGWRGVMETAEGSPLPDRFRSLAGGVYPVYHVLCDLGELAGSRVMPLQSSQPLAVEALGLERHGSSSIFLANLTRECRTVTLKIEGEAIRLRRLDEKNALHAMSEPEVYRSQAWETMAPPRNALEIALLPYAVVRIDCAASQAPAT